MDEEELNDYTDSNLLNKDYSTSRFGRIERGKARKTSKELNNSISRLKANLYLDKQTVSVLIIRFYTILITQQLLSFAFCVLSIKISIIQYTIKFNTSVFMIVFLLAALLSMSSFLLKGHLRNFPLNYFLLVVFSLCYAYILSYICININNEVVLMAIFTTFVITLILILYVSVAEHKYSIVGCGACVVFTGMIYYCFIFSYFDIQHIFIIISLVWLYVWGFYLIFWTRQLKKKYDKLKDQDYVLFSFKFYVAIIYVLSFIYGLKGHEKAFFDSLNEY